MAKICDVYYQFMGFWYYQIMYINMLNGRTYTSSWKTCISMANNILLHVTHSHIMTRWLFILLNEIRYNYFTKTFSEKKGVTCALVYNSNQTKQNQTKP